MQLSKVTLFVACIGVAQGTGMGTRKGGNGYMSQGQYDYLNGHEGPHGQPVTPLIRKPLETGKPKKEDESWWTKFKNFIG